jgi:hypothetical protein
MQCGSVMGCVKTVCAGVVGCGLSDDEQLLAVNVCRCS